MSHDNGPDLPQGQLTPPEQNRKNWQAITRFFATIKGAVLHPDRLWLQLTSWPVVSFLVALGIGSGIGVLSMTPPLFGLAKLCFIVAGIILGLKSAHWLATSQAVRWERMILSFLIFGVSGAILVEAWQWISRNESTQQRTPSPVVAPIVKRLLLTPGSHPTPPGPPCTGDMVTPLEVKKGEIAVFFGSSIVITKGTGVTIVTIDREPVLSFSRSVAEISLNALIRGKVPGEAVRITNNLVTYDETLYEILHPDAQHLVVIDKRTNGRLLSVNYLNQSAIVITGTFYSTRGPINVTDVGIALPGNMWQSEECFHNYEGPLFQY